MSPDSESLTNSLSVLFERWRCRLEKVRKDESLLEPFAVLRQQSMCGFGVSDGVLAKLIGTLDLVRDVFHRWLAALQKRSVLAQNEETVMYSRAVSTAYTVLETWRAKVVERRLSELERHFQLQMETNLRVYFFSRWYAQTTVRRYDNLCSMTASDERDVDIAGDQLPCHPSEGQVLEEVEGSDDTRTAGTESSAD